MWMGCRRRRRRLGQRQRWRHGWWFSLYTHYLKLLSLYLRYAIPAVTFLVVSVCPYAIIVLNRAMSLFSVPTAIPLSHHHSFVCGSEGGFLWKISQRLLKLPPLCLSLILFSHIQKAIWRNILVRSISSECWKLFTLSTMFFTLSWSSVMWIIYSIIGQRPVTLAWFYIFLHRKFILMADYGNPSVVVVAGGRGVIVVLPVVRMWKRTCIEENVSKLPNERRIWERKTSN